MLIFDSMSRLRHERVEHCRGFKAEVLDQNRRALHVFTRAAKTAKTEYDEGVYTTSYRLDDE